LREIVHHDHQNSKGEQYTEPKWGADKQTRVHLPVCLPLARAFNLRAGQASYALGKRLDCGTPKHTISSTVKAATIHYRVKRGGKGVIVLAPQGHRRSPRDIARELQVMGYTNKQGAPYSASCIKSMVEGPSP
jgi:hypothetical protein